MAYCDDLTAGSALFCGLNLGGIQEAFMTEWQHTAGTASGGTASIVVSAQNVVTTLTLSSGTYYRFRFREDTSSFTQTNTPTTSGDLVEQVAVLTFQNLSTTKANEFNLLRGKRLSLIVKDFNDQYWMLGYKFGVRLTSNVQSTGADRNDPNTWVVTLTGREPYFAYEVTSSLMTSYLV